MKTWTLFNELPKCNRDVCIQNWPFLITYLPSLVILATVFGEWWIPYSTEQFYFLTYFRKNQLRAFPPTPNAFLVCVRSHILHLRWMKSYYGTNLLCFSIPKALCYFLFHVCESVYICTHSHSPKTHTHMYNTYAYMYNTASYIMVQCDVKENIA